MGPPARSQPFSLNCTCYTVHQTPPHANNSPAGAPAVMSLCCCCCCCRFESAVVVVRASAAAAAAVSATAPVAAVSCQSGSWPPGRTPLPCRSCAPWAHSQHTYRHRQGWGGWGWGASAGKPAAPATAAAAAATMHSRTAAWHSHCYHHPGIHVNTIGQSKLQAGNKHTPPTVR